MQEMLSFDNVPPFGAPLRFFVTAPVLAVLAALLFVFYPDDVLGSRWTTTTLIATHLMTIGFMLQIMLGALIQVLPVVTGANIPRPLDVARAVHFSLNLGLLFLVLAFAGVGGAWAFIAAASLLLGAIFGFLSVAAYALWPVPSTSPTTRGIKLALLGLFGTVLLGGTLALGLALGWPIPWGAVTDLHASWGLVAWVGGLVAALAYVVVPMFQLTPGYPAKVSWWLPACFLGACGLWFLGVLLDAPVISRLAGAVAALAGGSFAFATLHLQARRRRAKWDATSRGWQFGMVCILMAAVMHLAGSLWPVLTEHEAWPVSFGVLLGLGGIMSLIIGMLYKIIPFLSWVHLQEVGESRVPAPPMTKMLAEQAMLRQLRLHFCAVGLLLGAVWVPGSVAGFVGLVFAGSNLFLMLNIMSMVGNYRRFASEIRAKLVQARQQ